MTLKGLLKTMVMSAVFFVSLWVQRKGLKLVAMKMMSPSKELLEQHYKDLSAKSFFPGLIAYMSSGPVVCMVWCVKHVPLGSYSTKPTCQILARFDTSAVLASLSFRLFLNGVFLSHLCREGKDAYKVGRALLGATKPSDSAPGTIRFDFAVDVGRNLCHGSDSDESAEAEIKLWFKPEEISAWDRCDLKWTYE